MISSSALSFPCWRSKGSWQIWCSNIYAFNVNWWLRWATRLQRYVVFLRARNILVLKNDVVDPKVTLKSECKGTSKVMAMRHKTVKWVIHYCFFVINAYSWTCITKNASEMFYWEGSFSMKWCTWYRHFWILLWN